MSPVRASLLLTAAALLACSSASGPAGQGGGSPDAAESSSSSSGSSGDDSCSASGDLAPTIAVTCDSSASQSAAGGAITDGTYFATTDVSLHDAPCDSTFPGSTLQIASGVFAFSFAPAPGEGDEHQQWSYVTSGSQLTLTLLCDTDPNGLVGTTVTAGYTSSGTELTLFYPSCCGDSYVGENVTFTRQ